MSHSLENYELIMFDLDGTLAPAKSSMDTEMAALLVKLLEKKKVAVISGGAFPQFETQFLNNLPVDTNNLGNLFLLPTSGTRLYTWKGAWHKVYAESLTPHQKEKITNAIHTAIKMAGFSMKEAVYGAAIEDRDSQITYSALGQSAPLDLKTKWDPRHEKRKKIAEILHRKIPEFDIRIGGTTSIDITNRGVNKAYGIRKMEEFLDISHEKILFVGDALFHGGNDYPAKAAGVDTISVKGPEETKEIVRNWIK
jgi:phosphomannomutase